MFDASSNALTVSRSGFTAKSLGGGRRFALQGRKDTLEGVAKAFGLAEAPAMLQSASAGDCTLLRLAPQELFIIAGEAGLPEAVTTYLGTVPNSLVEVSERQVGWTLEGERLRDTLAALSPLDLRTKSFPVGTATRTLFGKADGMLWRTDENSFHLEVWRSFAPYMVAMMDAAALDASW
ncbi:sarcosine oxidase subunit gamma [Acetobacter conturbans]|uniref:Sarcosine oxidase gamma subunit n=1 Tax=Acetobacter conturbans TaxID=1737472 RepID=A0ABX0K050_9PROT|nr:sarcosine oxidase subunit gamma family protein [Acetobacter conturbans]NHN88991.1 sarcosine oxidase gamma subunit [Acetobacter conturbans]